MNKLKLFKYVAYAALILIISFVPGEVFQGYLDQYNDFARTSFYLPKGEKCNEMLTNLSEGAQKHNIHIFKVIEREKTTFSLSIDFYLDEDIEEVLKDKYEITSGEYKSILGGTSKIRYFKFEELEEEDVVNNVDYYLWGNPDDMEEFKAELVDRYAGCFPKFDGYNDLQGYRGYVIFGWGIVLIIAGLLNLFMVAVEKKEVFVRLSMGEEKKRIFLEYLIPDTIVIMGAFVFSQGAVFLTEGKFVFFTITLTGIFVFLLTNALLLLGLFAGDIREGLAGYSGRKTVLYLGYSVFAVAILLLCFVSFSSVDSAYAAYRYKAQEPFFIRYKDLYWVNGFGYKDWENKPRAQEPLQKYLESNPGCFLGIAEWFEFDSFTMYMARESSLGYLKEQVDELPDAPLEKPVMLIPSSNNVVKDLSETFELSDYDVIFYDETLNVVVRMLEDNPITTDIVRNPVIEICADSNDVNNSIIMTSYYISYMADMDQSGFREYLEQNELQMRYQTNVLDNFYYQWERKTRTVWLNLLAILILTLMVVALGITVIRIDFAVNAKELAIKKVSGYSVWQRYGAMYVILLAEPLLVAVCVIIYKIIIRANNIFLPAVPVFLVGAGCLLGGTLYIIKNEKKQLNRVFKGEI